MSVVSARSLVRSTYLKQTIKQSVINSSITRSNRQHQSVRSFSVSINPGWMSNVTANGLEHLKGAFHSPDRFDSCLNGLVIETVESKDGLIRGKFDLSKTGSEASTHSLANSYGTMHGGVTATIVDVIGTMSIMAADRQRRGGVSVDINVSYLRPAPLDDTLLIESKCLKAGKSLSFANVEIRRASDNELVAIGRHTKALPKL